MKFLKPLVLAAILFTGLSSMVQDKNGSIAGTVKDAATKNPLIEAVITLSSSAFVGQRLALTDSSGMYKIDNLPAGFYTIIFEMEGYRKFIKDSIQLSKAMPMGVSLEMVRERR